MGKRTAIAFFLSLLVIISYNYLITNKYSPAPPLETADAVLQPQQDLQPQAQSAQRPQQGAQLDIEAATALSRAKDFVVETDLVRAVITSSGARIKSFKLKQYPAEKMDPQLLRRKISEVELNITRASAESKELLLRQKAKLEALLARVEAQPEMAEMVSMAATVSSEFSPAIFLPARPVQSEAGGPARQDTTFALNTARYRCSQEALVLSEERPQGQREFIYTDAQGRQVNKTYTFYNSNYSIGLDISFSGWEQTDVSAGNFRLVSGPDVGMPQQQRGRRTYGYQGPVSCFQAGQQSWAQREKYARDEQNRIIQREHKDKGRILWTGLENKYFLSALIPLQAAEAVLVEKNRFGEQKVALAIPWQGSGVYKFKLYLGPKKEERLKEIDATLEKARDYGFFGPIARFIYQALVFFSRGTHNFGWAIVLLCLAVKIIFYPLTHRSFESMQKMQQDMKTVQPEMNALREKYKANPQKLNKETMELYRRKGINPLASCQSGCLPLLLQMPVFFALYGVLYSSIELRGAPFIGWITDLSAKDPYYVLPILMGVSMFAQQKLTGMGAAGGAQQEQAKMMGVLMPVFLTWIFASLPSGVVLYWLTFNVLTSLQQLLIKKKQVAQ